MGNIDPKDVNTELEAQTLKQIEAITQYGVEVTYPLAKVLDVGLRFTHRIILRDELLTTATTDYQAQLNQDSAMFVARIPFVKTKIMRMDAFAGLGGSNTSLKIKTAGQDGEVHRKESGDWVAAPVAAYGASVALGYKMFYLVIEGGMETNKVTNLKRTGNVNTNIEAIDLSGSYFTVGLMFDGISASQK